MDVIAIADKELKDSQDFDVIESLRANIQTSIESRANETDNDSNTTQTETCTEIRASILDNVEARAKELSQNRKASLSLDMTEVNPLDLAEEIKGVQVDHLSSNS